MIDLASPSPQDSVLRTAALPDARGVALWPDGRVAVSRWRSPSTGGQLALVEPDSGTVTLVTLQIDPQIASHTEVGGVPNYLSDIAVSPQGDEAVLPHTQMNILEGSYRSGKARRSTTTRCFGRPSRRSSWRIARNNFPPEASCRG